MWTNDVCWLRQVCVCECVWVSDPTKVPVPEGAHIVYMMLRNPSTIVETRRKSCSRSASFALSVGLLCVPLAHCLRAVTDCSGVQPWSLLLCTEPFKTDLIWHAWTKAMSAMLYKIGMHVMIRNDSKCMWKWFPWNQTPKHWCRLLTVSKETLFENRSFFA